MSIQITINNIKTQLDEEIGNLLQLEARYDELIYHISLCPNNSVGSNHSITFQK